MSTASTNMLQLPVASGLDGSESVWVVQGGTDKRTTTGTIAAEGQDLPTNAPFLVSEVYGFLPSSRVLTGTTGIVILTDNGVGSTLVISLNAAGISQLITAPRTITVAGDVTVAASDVAIYMRQTVAQAVNIILPAAASKTGPVFVCDANGVAASNNFTLVPNGAETIVGLSSYAIDANYMSLNLRPISGVGWVL